MAGLDASLTLPPVSWPPGRREYPKGWTKGAPEEVDLDSAAAVLGNRAAAYATWRAVAAVTRGRVVGDPVEAQALRHWLDQHTGAGAVRAWAVDRLRDIVGHPDEVPVHAAEHALCLASLVKYSGQWERLHDAAVNSLAEHRTTAESSDLAEVAAAVHRARGRYWGHHRDGCVQPTVERLVRDATAETAGRYFGLVERLLADVVRGTPDWDTSREIWAPVIDELARLCPQDPTAAVAYQRWLDDQRLMRLHDTRWFAPEPGTSRRTRRLQARLLWKLNVDRDAGGS